MHLRRLSLYSAVATPVIYYGTLIAASLLYPGYSHVTQYASELGSAQATHPAIFNTGIFIAGITAILGSAGLSSALTEASGRRVLSILTGIAVALYGIGLLFGSLFPMPNPLHGGFGAGFAIHLGPIVALAALWGRPNWRGLRAFLAINSVAMLIMLAIMMGIGELVTTKNVGIFQRGYSLTVMVWIAVVGLALLRSANGMR